MTQDASFEDGRERPLNLGALDQDDLQVVSTLIQDAVFPASEMIWDASQRRFAILTNRFRWEDRSLRDQSGHAVERVQTVLSIDNVLGIASQGIERANKDVIFSALSLQFEPGPDAGGTVLLTLAGDGAIKLSIEALEVRLKDVTRPYRALSKTVPDHGQ
jgi:hypothetical protein